MDEYVIRMETMMRAKKALHASGMTVEELELATDGAFVRGKLRRLLAGQCGWSVWDVIAVAKGLGVEPAVLLPTWADLDGMDGLGGLAVAS
ncbi:MAG: hypothetical protein LBK54_01655 [Propionibacteriaceae bacterium]|jgi:hypothetical protein|nr:hypothetical protein [Propionibacteriaceae bacterium]